MKKRILSFGLILFATVSFAQTSDPIRKAVQNPEREKESAKADLYVQDKKVLSKCQRKAPGGDKIIVVKKEKKAATASPALKANKK